MILLPIAEAVGKAPTISFAANTARVSLSDPQSGRLPFAVHNRTKRPIVVWLAHFSANHGLRLTHESGQPATRTPLGTREEADYKAGGPIRDKNATITLPPGGVYRDSILPLGERFLLRPGRYRLVLEYRDRKGGLRDFSKAELHLVSDPLAVTVVP